MSATPSSVPRVSVAGFGAAALRSRPFALRAVAVAAAASELMSFLDHLDELRRRLIWSLVAIAVAFGLCWIYADALYAIASEPVRANTSAQLAVFRPQDIFALSFKVTLVASLFLSAPFVLCQAWFLSRRACTRASAGTRFRSCWRRPCASRPAAPSATSSRFRRGVHFLVGWTVHSHLVPMFDATAYFDLLCAVILALGLVFEIPVVIFVLSRFGLVSASLLATHLKSTIFASAVVAAVITPTTDPGNMLIIAGPTDRSLLPGHRGRVGVRQTSSARMRGNPGRAPVHRLAPRSPTGGPTPAPLARPASALGRDAVPGDWPQQRRLRRTRSPPPAIPAGDAAARTGPPALGRHARTDRHRRAWRPRALSGRAAHAGGRPCRCWNVRHANQRSAVARSMPPWMSSPATTSRSLVSNPATDARSRRPTTSQVERGGRAARSTIGTTCSPATPAWSAGPL